jgi:hypothetical protein
MMQIHSGDTSISSLSVSNPDLPPQLAADQQCPLHKLLIHSYHSHTQKLYCTLCVQAEENSKNLVQFPTVVNQIKQRIQQAQDLNKLRKMQLS